MTGVVYFYVNTTTLGLFERDTCNERQRSVLVEKANDWIHERKGFTPTRLSVEVEKVVLNELHNSVELLELATDDSEALHVGFAEIVRRCVSHELAEVICDILKVR